MNRKRRVRRRRRLFAAGGLAVAAGLGLAYLVASGTFDHAIQMQAKHQPVVAVLQFGRYPGLVLAMMSPEFQRR